jgi:hypothetical protein
MGKARDFLPGRRATERPDRCANLGLGKMEGKHCHKFLAAQCLGVQLTSLSVALARERLTETKLTGREGWEGRTTPCVLGSAGG